MQGWPSFSSAVADSVDELPDYSIFFLPRTEVSFTPHNIDFMLAKQGLYDALRCGNILSKEEASEQVRSLMEQSEIKMAHLASSIIFFSRDTRKMQFTVLMREQHLT